MNRMIQTTPLVILLVAVLACSSPPPRDYIQEISPDRSRVAILGGRTEGIEEIRRRPEGPTFNIWCHEDWPYPSMHVGIGGEVMESAVFGHARSWSGHGIDRIEITIGDWDGVSKSTGEVEVWRDEGEISSIRWKKTWDYRDPFARDIYANLINSTADHFIVRPRHGGRRTSLVATHTFPITDEIRAVMRETFPPSCYE